MHIDVTVEISTKNRYNTTLPMCLLSIAQQTYKPKKVLMFDDGEQKDLRNDPVYASIFALFATKNIEFECIFGKRKGQVHNHQMAIHVANTEWIWRVDDDDTPEANVLEILVSHIADDVGAISGLVLVPGENHVHTGIASSKIEDIYTKPNLQWFRFSGVQEVDHMNNSFLFRKEAAKHGYCMELSPVGHREETMFTYEMKRAGYKLLVDSSAVIWHLRSPSGGIRSYESEFFWEHDEKIFARKLKEYGIYFKENKIIVLDCGMGDHYAFKMILPEIKEKYNDKNLILAVSYPEVFADDNIPLISIGDAQKIDNKIEEHNIYKFMTEKNWKGKLVDAFRSKWL
jgi:GT2 family glycosyltransferase